MFKFSALADYGLVLITHITTERFTSIHDLVKATHLPAATLAKLATKLEKHSLLVSKEGRGGGYKLALPGTQITLRAIVEALEGPIAPTRCVAHPGSCRFENICNLKSHWPQLTHDLIKWAESYTLTDLAQQK